MTYIRQLSEELIKKIAAGEVIERPASVVKELIENSIDANASKIEIVIQRAGKYIKVLDNGEGIHSTNIPLLFSRHATSKINDINDLWGIYTLGFRGEALASISSVSKITCSSKHKDEENGFELKVKEDSITKKSAALSCGTSFEVEDLFYSVPARLKFLKSETTELGHIYDVVLSHALSHPEVLFKLINNKNTILETSGSSELQQVIVELLGSDLKSKLISIKGRNQFLSVNGYVSSLEISRSDRKSILIFINKRPVKCHIISKAIQNAFEGLLPGGKYPVIVINLDFNPGFVDVNVHPSKKEVRYTNPNEVYNLIFGILQEGISKHYKEKYKENSTYSLAEVKEVSFQSPSSSKIDFNYSQAAIDFYKEAEITSAENLNLNGDYKPSSGTDLNLFSISNLKCKIIFSDKPVANMVKAGIKTIFEVGSVFEDNFQLVFSGEITGDERYQSDFFNSLSELGRKIYMDYSKENLIIQKKIVSPLLEDEQNNSDNGRNKPGDAILYNIWKRDNWTCVYCGKQLLDPKIVKSSMPHSQDAFNDYVNKNGEKVTVHMLKEYSASYDHFLPASKFPQFNYEPENLFACCFECNRKKSDSLELNAWKPNRQNNWTKPLIIGGISFDGPDRFSELPENTI